MFVPRMHEFPQNCFELRIRGKMKIAKQTNSLGNLF